MAQASAKPDQPSVALDARANLAAALEPQDRKLIVFRLRCAQTANGLSHYYMYGDLEPAKTVL